MTEEAAPTIQRVAAVEASLAGRARNSSASAPLSAAASDSRRSATMSISPWRSSPITAPGAAAQRFLHRPQEVAASRGGNRQQPLGGETKRVEAGAVGRAAFGERHVLGEPDDVFRHSGTRRRRGPGIQMQFLNLFLDSGFTGFARAPE